MSNTDQVIRRYLSGYENIIKSYLPMSEQGFLLLFSLQEERHGYAIMQYATELTGGRVNMGAGTVYTMLYKMESDGMIEVVREADRRKVYKITDVGMAVLYAESSRIAQLYDISQNVGKSIGVMA